MSTAEPRAPTPSERVRGTRRADFVIVLAMLAYAGLVMTLSLLRFTHVQHRTFDLALYARMAWGLVHGQAWDPIVGGGFLGGHVPVVLAPLGALGLLFGTVPTLLLAQSIAIAFAAWPLSRIALRRLGPAAAVLVSLAWLLQPNLGHVATYEFHPGNLALWPMAGAFDAIDRGRGRMLLWCCVGTIACRAGLSLQTLLIGWLALSGPPSLRRAGRIVAVGSALYFALWLLWLQPHFGGRGAGSSMALHYGLWGGSPVGVLRVLLTHPARVFDHFTEPARLLYPLVVLAPLSLLPLLAPRVALAAAPPVLLNLLSEFPTAVEYYSHYLTPALPPLSAAAVFALARRPTTGRRWGLLALAVAALVASLLAGGLPWSLDFPAQDFRPGPRTAERRAMLSAIDERVSVQAPDPLLPHLAERRRVHRAPPPDRDTQVVVLDLGHRVRHAGSGDLLRTLEEPEARRWLSRDDYGAELAAGHLVLMRRGLSPREGVALRYFQAPPSDVEPVALTDCLSVAGARLLPTAVTLVLLAHGPCPEDLALRLGSEPIPARVDLPFDGLLSPAQLREGDRLRSTHKLGPQERRAIETHGLRVGALRSSGARPRPQDPPAVDVPLLKPAR